MKECDGYAACPMPQQSSRVHRRRRAHYPVHGRMVGLGHFTEDIGEAKDVPVERLHRLHVSDPDANVIYAEHTLSRYSLPLLLIVLMFMRAPETLTVNHAFCPFLIPT